MDFPIKRSVPVRAAKTRQQVARETKRRVLEQLAVELPKLAAAQPKGIALSRLRTLANLAEQLSKTRDDDLVSIGRIIKRIEDEMAAAQR